MLSTTPNVWTLFGFVLGVVVATTHFSMTGPRDEGAQSFRQKGAQSAPPQKKERWAMVQVWDCR